MKLKIGSLVLASLVTALVAASPAATAANARWAGAACSIFDSKPQFSRKRPWLV